MIRNPNNPTAFQRVIGFNKKNLTIIIINHIKTAKLTTIGQNITYKINTSGMIKLR